MTQTTIELQVNGLTCGSCEKIIRRTIGKFENASVESFDFDRGKVSVTASETDIGKIVSTLKEKGYHTFLTKDIEELEGETELDRLRYVLTQLTGNHPKFSLERKMIQTAFFSLLGTLAIALIFPVLFPTAKPLLGLFILGSIMIALTIFSVQHIQSFGRQSCNTGMMTGMGIGMMSGFMAGALVGASSGMFWGSIIGMMTGMFLGVKIGRSCGNMGVLEGLMAGLMAGTMGAMLSVMLVFDHQFEFLIILWITCAAILMGLSYMMIKELGVQPKNPVLNAEKTILMAVILSVLLNVFMWAGPKVVASSVGGA